MTPMEDLVLKIIQKDKSNDIPYCQTLDWYLTNLPTDNYKLANQIKNRRRKLFNKMYNHVQNSDDIIKQKIEQSQEIKSFYNWFKIPY